MIFFADNFFVEGDEDEDEDEDDEDVVVVVVVVVVDGTDINNSIIYNKTSKKRELWSEKDPRLFFHTLEEAERGQRPNVVLSRKLMEKKGNFIVFSSSSSPSS